MWLWLLNFFKLLIFFPLGSFKDFFLTFKNSHNVPVCGSCLLQIRHTQDSFPKNSCRILLTYLCLIGSAFKKPDPVTYPLLYCCDRALSHHCVSPGLWHSPPPGPSVCLLPLIALWKPSHSCPSVAARAVFQSFKNSCTKLSNDVPFHSEKKPRSLQCSSDPTW